MSEVVALNDERINVKCAAVRDLILAFENHQNEMSNTQIIKLCNEIIGVMIDILEMVDEQ
jgi:hypothetical protein